MTLPVSNYQELLIQVRELTHETIRLQRQLSSDLFDNADPPDVNHNFSLSQKNYENGKQLTDNVIRQSEKSRKEEIGQNSLVGYDNLRFRPRFCQNLDSSEGIRAGELTSRLLTWRSRSHRPIILQEDADDCQKRPERSLSEECRVSHGPVGVGVEGVGSWRAQRRPHNIEISAPLSGVAAHELESSVDGATFNPVAAAATTSTRCSLVKNTLKTPLSSSTFLPVNANIRPRLYLGSVIAETSKEDAMEPEVKEEDERRSSTPSPEQIYIRRNKRYNEGGSSEEDSKPDTSLQGHRIPSSYRGTWPIRRDIWANQQMGFSTQQGTSTTVHNVNHFFVNYMSHIQKKEQ